MEALLAAAGHPEAGLKSVVVAGTKGKGSTAAMIEAIARAAGLRVGLFTSPHLNSYRERMQIGRELISQRELIALVCNLQPVLAAFDPAPYGRPTTFDVGFLLALVHFARQQVDLAVLEIGLGGRFDAVNVITPLVSVISSISYDHMAILGQTLAEIAWNKAGIIKPGVPVITIPQAPEAMPAIVEEAEQQGAPLWMAHPEGVGPWQIPPTPYPVKPVPALRGQFQVENARLAVGTALRLRETGLPLADQAIADGLATVRWPGRFELVAGAPLILIDGAHNGDSAQKLIAAIKHELSYERLVLVLGTSRDKPLGAITAALVPHAAGVVITRSGHPRAMDVDRMVAEVGAHLRGPLVVTHDVRTALDAARRLAHPQDLIVITGSLFMVADARETLGLAVSD
ncbi:MAG: bifunctional folylpolyglutamate synthase/dihydrofolate synthase [Oscillochloridaceae bacterium umkhey_bin13]